MLSMISALKLQFVRGNDRNSNRLRFRIVCAAILIFLLAPTLVSCHESMSPDSLSDNVKCTEESVTVDGQEVQSNKSRLLNDKNKIITNEKGVAVISFPTDKMSASLDPKSEMTARPEQGALFQQTLGCTHVVWKDRPEKRNVQVTPYMTIRSADPAIRIEVSPEGEARVAVYAGSVTATVTLSNGQKQTCIVPEKQELRVPFGNHPTVMPPLNPAYFSISEQELFSSLAETAGVTLHPTIPVDRLVVNSPTPGATNVDPQAVVLSWEPVPGATDYLVNVATDSSLADSVAGMPKLISATSVQLPKLLGGTSYYYRVQALGLRQALEATGTFATKVIVPTSITLLNPTPNAHNLDPRGIVFSWDEVAGAFGYTVTIATDYGLNEVVSGTPAEVSEGPFRAPSLSYATTYFYRVRASGPGLSLEATGSFTTMAAPSITITTPSRGATDVNPKPVALSWTAVAGATSYEVTISKSSDFSVVEINTNTGRLSFSSDLDYGTTYYVRVRAGLVQATSSFTTMAAPSITITSPSRGATDVNPKPVALSWTAVAGATSYELAVADVPNFAIITFSTTTDKLGYSADLEYGTTYYVKVTAGGFTTTSYFTTMPPPVTTISPPVTTTIPPDPPDVTDIATSGTTIYTVDAANAMGSVYRYSSGGAFARLPSPAPMALKHVAAARDNPEIVAVCGDSAVYLSLDAGGTWIALPAMPTNDVIRDLDISPSSPRFLAVATGARVYQIEIGGTVGAWVNASGWAGYDSSTRDVLSVKYSPNFMGDRTLVALTCSASALVLQLANTNSLAWNGGLYGSPQVILPYGTMTFPSGGILSGALALSPNFLAIDPVRVTYAGITAGSLGSGGLYRIIASSVTRLYDGNIYSVAINDGGDKLLAGRYETSELVKGASPASATADSASPIPIGIDTVANETVVTGWLDYRVLAGTSGPQSGFFVSTNDGATFAKMTLP